MKSFFSLCCTLLTCSLFAQHKFDGLWEGHLPASVSLRIVFEFATQPDGSIKGILRSPDQSPKALPADTTYIAGDTIFSNARKLGISFTGRLTNDSSINGSFRQGSVLPLILKKVQSISAARRPQTPVPPFPYNSNEVAYYNADRSIHFSGTLTAPGIDSSLRFIKPPVFPVILLITGSGPQDRDETIALHKPFAVIADYLTQKGFIVLRVDDRGTGKTTGVFATATSADFANDVEAGLDYLKTLPGVDTNRIALLGHSEGGMIAPMVASRRSDVKTIILLAGPGIPITQLLPAQVEAITMAGGLSAAAGAMSKKIVQVSIEIVLKNMDTAARNNFISARLEKNISSYNSALAQLDLATPALRKKYIEAQVGMLSTQWYKYFLAFDPQPYLQKLSCSVLALNGGKDIQVLAAANLAGIGKALKKSRSKKFDVKEMPGLNHLFQTCKKCNVAEYSEIEESFSPAALQVISDWLLAQL